MIISFQGSVGCGKGIVARVLQKFLKEQKIKCSKIKEIPSQPQSTYLFEINYTNKQLTELEKLQ